MMTTTLKGTTVALGIGLAILWIAGLSSPYAPGWLTWLDGVGALAAFVIAGSLQMGDTRGKRVGGPIGLCLALFALGIIGLATGATAWLSWWTFAFACAFLILGVAAGNVPEAERSMSTQGRVNEPETPEFLEPRDELGRETEEKRKPFKKAG